jgi:ABC-type branched-subunit amino acid transport system substrate-binding protein
VGYDVIYSARLAVREINAAGGIAGHRVALIALDDGGDPELAMATAYSLSNDPAVVAVIGHWLPEASAAAAPIYAEAGLPFLETGVHPFAVSDPSELPADFLAAYEATTPFDEVAGPHAAASYDAFQLMWRALSEASEVGGTLERSAVDLALAGLEIEGLKGTVYRP